MSEATRSDAPPSGAAPSLRDRALALGSRIDEILALLVLAYCIVMAFKRLQYGVDPADESFAVALTQRFTLGDRPYTDEWNLRQTAGLLPVPLYWLYLKIVGSTDGIVYFLRVCFMVVQLGVGFAAYELAEKRVPRAFAYLAAALPVTFIPFSMPCPNYNNLGAMLLACGTMIGLRGFLEKNDKTLFWAGLVHGLACVAYPPHAVPVTMFALSTRFLPDRPLAKESPWRASLQYAKGILLVAIPFLLILGPGVVKGVRHALEYEGQTTRPRNPDKLRGALKALQALSPASPASLATVGVAGLVAAKAPHLRKLVFAFGAAWIAYAFCDAPPELRGQLVTHILTLHISIYLGLFGLVFLMFVDWQSFGRVFLVCAWLPAFVAGLMSAMASDNNAIMNAGLGLFGAALLAMITAPMASDTPDVKMNAYSRAGLVVALATVPLTNTSVNYAGTYSDGPVSDTYARVHIGPFRGLKGMPDKVARIEDLTREVRAHHQPGERMLSFYDFPGAYLMVPARPNVQTVWTDRRAKIETLLPYYRAHRTGRGIAVMLVAPGFSGISAELEGMYDASASDRLLKDGGWYRIYREPPP